MSKSSYIPPVYKVNAFNCPHCHAFSNHHWIGEGTVISTMDDRRRVDPLVINQEFAACQCVYCQGICLWLDGKLIYPDSTNFPPANADLPDEIRSLYDEAASIFQKSPRASAALLRVALQHLCKKLGGKGENIYKDIKGFQSEKGLSPRILKSMNIIRVLGNNAAHPGEIDINENPAIAAKLFSLINIIVDELITKEREIKELHDGLPDSQKLNIE